MTPRARLLRRIEIALWVVGIGLLGVAVASSFDRWNYQAQQERALFQSAPAPLPAREPERGPEAVAGRADSPPAPPRQTAAVKAAASGRTPKSDPTALGRIEIPRLGVRAMVKEGGDEKTLARAVGLIPGSARPGEEGNMVLAGHRDTFFRRLEHIETNDTIRLVLPSETYEYRVRSVRIVEPEETSVLASRGVEEVTLVTCYPFTFVGPAPDRFIVTAARVN